MRTRGTSQDVPVDSPDSTSIRQLIDGDDPTLMLDGNGEGFRIRGLRLRKETSEPYEPQSFMLDSPEARDG